MSVAQSGKSKKRLALFLDGTWAVVSDNTLWEELGFEGVLGVDRV
jgi:hypothetical protein